MSRQTNVPSKPLFEIVDERTVPRRPRGPSLIKASLDAARAVVEKAYVSFAGGAMGRFEQIEDVRAERSYNARARKAARRRSNETRRDAVSAPVAR